MTSMLARSIQQDNRDVIAVMQDDITEARRQLIELLCIGERPHLIDRQRAALAYAEACLRREIEGETLTERLSGGETTSLTVLPDGGYRVDLDGLTIGYLTQIEQTRGWYWRRWDEIAWHTLSATRESAWDALLVATGGGR